MRVICHDCGKPNPTRERPVSDTVGFKDTVAVCQECYDVWGQKLLKKAFPDKTKRDAVVKGTKIMTGLEKYYKDKSEDTEKDLDNTIEDAEDFLKEVDAKKQHYGAKP